MAASTMSAGVARAWARPTKGDFCSDGFLATILTAEPPSSFGFGASLVATAESLFSLGIGPRAACFGAVAQPIIVAATNIATHVVRMCGLIRHVVVPIQAICVTSTADSET